MAAASEPACGSGNSPGEGHLAAGEAGQPFFSELLVAVEGKNVPGHQVHHDEVGTVEITARAFLGGNAAGNEVGCHAAVSLGYAQPGEAELAHLAADLPRELLALVPVSVLW